jgi:hypothetical protein
LRSGDKVSKAIKPPEIPGNEDPTKEIQKSVGSSIANLIDMFGKHLADRITTPFPFYYFSSFIVLNIELILTSIYKKNTIEDFIIDIERKGYGIYTYPLVSAVLLTLFIPLIGVGYGYFDHLLDYLKKDIRELKKDNELYRDWYDAGQKSMANSATREKEVAEREAEVSRREHLLESQKRKNLQIAISQEQLTSQVGKLTDEIDNLKNEKKELNDVLKNLAAESASNGEKAKRAEAKYEQLEVEYGNIQNKLVSSSEQINTKNLEIGQLRNKIVIGASNEKEVQRTLQLLQKDNEELKRNIEKMEKEAKLNTDNISLLVDQIDDNSAAASPKYKRKFWQSKAFAVECNQHYLANSLTKTQDDVVEEICEKNGKTLDELPPSFQGKAHLLWAGWRSKGYFDAA